MSRKSHVTTDHDAIRRWAEERGARPARVKGTYRPASLGVLRIDFPGYSGEQSLEPIEWDEFFEGFESSNLALVYQDTTAEGQPSNFNKLVARESVDVQKDDSHAGPSRKLRKAVSVVEHSRALPVCRPPSLAGSKKRVSAGKTTTVRASAPSQSASSRRGASSSGRATSARARRTSSRKSGRSR